MNIGIIIGRIGDVDGVALETEKWIQVLQRMGHEIYILSGVFKGQVVAPERQTHLPILSFFSPECEWEQNRAFFYPPDDPDELLTTIDKNAHSVSTAIFSWVLRNKIDVILTENCTALPCHLSMGLGIMMAVENMHIPVVSHDHDYAWERGDRYASPFREIKTMVEETFPLQNGPNVRHAVINSAARQELEDRFGILAMVVPNVMDFEQPFGLVDDYNEDLLDEIGFHRDDIALFQITRIVERKGIEVAIDVINRLDNPKMKLVITGSAADDERKGYYKQLVERVESQGLQDRVRFAYRRMLSNRGRTRSGKKRYSLSDAYARSVACTYFSTYEGFGNAFVEAVLAKRPVFVNNYKPVFWPDIGSKGFECVMLEDNQLTDEAVGRIDEVLRDEKLQTEIAEHNFELGRKHFSYEVLERKLEVLFSA
ncbi:MAG: glycosyltransferase family 4 protein [Planctomycetota bacterium]|jgi:glycosyltransferase involved in cell wall biosynthesis